MNKSRIYLLCGLPGSGKSTWSEKFVKENPNTVWYKLDREFFKKHKSSFYGQKFNEYEDEIKKEILEKAKQDIADNKGVILDYGFWKKADREEYKKIVTDLGAEPKLLYFKQDNKILLERLLKRNEQDLVHEHKIDENMFSIFLTQFEEPKEDEDFQLLI